MGRYDFLVDTYRTERHKTLSVWSQIPDARMRDRSEPRARSPLDHMVHQCVSEDGWMTSMLGIAVSRPVLLSGDASRFPGALRRRLGGAAGGSGDQVGQLVRGDDSVFRCGPIACLGSGPSVHSLRSPSGTTDLLPAFVGAVTVLDVRPDG